MTTMQASPILSAQDLLRLGEQAGVEYADGRVWEKPVSIESSKIEGNIFALLNAQANQSGAASVFPSSLGYRCYPEDPNKFRKPDVSLVRTERLATIDSGEGFMPIPADLAVEVISPNDMAEDVAEMVEEYLRHDFKLVWIVQPRTRTVTIFRADGSVARLHEKDEITAEAALPGFRCKVGEFFARPG